MAQSFHVVLLGAGSVGKTTSVIRLQQNMFVEWYDPTIEDYYRKIIDVDGISTMLEILDTASEEENPPGRERYIQDGQGFILMYSITSRASFDSLSFFYNLILSINHADEYPMVLVGNKCDLEKERQISFNEGEELSRIFKCPFFESSVKENINVTEFYQEIARQVRYYLEGINIIIK